MFRIIKISLPYSSRPIIEEKGNIILCLRFESRGSRTNYFVCVRPVPVLIERGPTPYAYLLGLFCDGVPMLPKRGLLFVSCARKICVFTVRRARE